MSYLENDNYKMWELIFKNVKEFFIFAKTEQISFKQKKIKTKEHEICELKKEHAGIFNYKRLKTLKAELDSLYDKRAKGAQIRSKIKWIEEGKKQFKFFKPRKT